MSYSPSLIESSPTNSEIQGTAKMRENNNSRHLVLPDYDDESEQSKSIQRKRVLPPWMLERDLLVQAIAEPVMKAGNRTKKGHRRGETESLKSEINVHQKKRLAAEEFEGEEQDQGKKSCLSISVPSFQMLSTDKLLHDLESQAEAFKTYWGGIKIKNTSGFLLENTMRNVEGNGETGTKNPGSSLENSGRQLDSKKSKKGGQISRKENRTEETENKEQISGSTSQQANWGRTSQFFDAQEWILEPDANLDYKTEISDSTRSADASESSKQVKCKRTPCMYGTGCYRKNPIHFQQFSHPNDDDYQEVEIVTPEDNDDRPECPYGTACYRKNPQHKLEYKHSAPPAMERRTRQATSKNGKRAVEKDDANADEPNEYDLTDSFIDDEEEECEPTDEDSDWEPSPEDKYDEDVETLLQEAHRFVKTKK